MRARSRTYNRAMNKWAWMAFGAVVLAGCGGNDSANPLSGSNFNPTGAIGSGVNAPTRAYEPLPVFITIAEKEDLSGMRVNLQSVSLKSATGSDEVIGLNPGARVDLGALKERLIFVGMGNKNGAYNRANIALGAEAKKMMAAGKIDIVRLAQAGAKTFESYVTFDPGMTFKDALVIGFKPAKEGLSTVLGNAADVGTLEKQETVAFRGSISEYVPGKSFTLRSGATKLPVKITAATAYFEEKALKNGSVVLVTGRYVLGSGFQAERIIEGQGTAQLVTGRVVSHDKGALTLNPLWTTADATEVKIATSDLVKYDEGQKVSLIVTSDPKTKEMKVAELKDTSKSHLNPKIRP